jgi:8-oxo-dGTP pyrophosphatase MutT (NUDIX family)
VQAAVLLPLIENEDGWHLLFIRRTHQKNDRHGGQVAFPGGRWEPEDKNAKQAALREAFEETGLKAKDVRILGCIQDLVTITGYLITPVVGVIPWPYNLIPQPNEVDRIFTIPLHWLSDPTNKEVCTRDLQLQGKSIPVIYFKSYKGEILWGASARITVLLLEALRLSTPSSRYSLEK